MSYVQCTTRYMLIPDTQLGGYIMVFPNLYLGKWLMYWVNPSLTFIRHVNEFKICVLMSFNYESTQPSKNIYLEAMRCSSITEAELNAAHPIPESLIQAYRAGYVGYVRRHRREAVRVMCKLLDDQIDHLDMQLAGYIIVAIESAFPYVGDFLIERTIGTWITVNPIYEAGRWYGLLCHGLVPSNYAGCVDLEKVMEANYL